jgi:hypothetical protein
MGFFLEKKPVVVSGISLYLVRQLLGAASAMIYTGLYKSFYTRRFTKKFHTTILYPSGKMGYYMMTLYF